MHNIIKICIFMANEWMDCPCLLLEYLVRIKDMWHHFSWQWTAHQLWQAMHPYSQSFNYCHRRLCPAVTVHQCIGSLRAPKCRVKHSLHASRKIPGLTRPKSKRFWCFCYSWPGEILLQLHKLYIQLTCSLYHSYVQGYKIQGFLTAISERELIFSPKCPIGVACREIVLMFSSKQSLFVW